MELLFRDVTLSLSQQTILNGVSGFCRPGEMLAIMGPTGSGKTSLLNVLAGRISQIERGSIFLDGHVLNKTLKRKIVYILQQDIFFTNLTLRQTLTFMALLRLPDTMRYEEKIRRVDEIVATLDLRKCLDVRIGDQLTGGLSGGEKKIANIATELLSNPELMYIDEPTTGLDSHHAYDMMMMLKLYTEKERKTVVVTIHQPSSQIFHMFDRLLLLSGGHVAYFGESNKILNYFSNLGLHCTPHYNPADFILEAVSTDEEVHERIINSYLEMRESMEEFGLTQLDEIDLDDTESVIDMNFMNSTSNNLVMTRCDQEPVRSMMTHRPAHETKRQHHLHSIKKWYEDYYDEKWPTCFWTQYTVLTKRNFIQAKNKILSKWAAIQVVSVAIMAGLVWFQIERTEERLTDRKGILFFTIIYWMVTPMMATLSAFPEEREVLNKERSAGVYRLSAYYLAKLTSELPLAVTLPTLYLIIVYPMVGLNGYIAFFGMWFFLMLNAVASQSFGLLAGAYFLNQSQGVTMCVTVSLFYMMMGGFYVEHFPIWLRWGRFISPPYYTFQAFNYLELHDSPPVQCAKHNSLFATCVANNSTVITSDELLSHLDIIVPLYFDFVYLFCYTLLCYALGYFVLRCLRRPDYLVQKQT